MTEEDLELYPILHKGRIYNIFTSIEMTFREVRAMIDWLHDRGAFPNDEAGAREPELLYSCPAEGSIFDVDVQGYEIIVYKKEPA
ncbi:MAG: hypothetical protein FWF95_05565 [Syntrophorhabdaceae bacterium]|nr:hypothetical protein [Syntrophorhabdaceae bacterium]